MSDENKALCRRFFDGINRRNLDESAALLAADYVWHGPGMELRGPEGFKQLIGMYLSAFPDMVLTIDDLIAEGDKVVTQWTGRGTHLGELSGVAASGRPVAVPGITISRIVNGRIAEDHEVFDNLGMFQLIGTLPALSASV